MDATDEKRSDEAEEVPIETVQRERVEQPYARWLVAASYLGTGLLLLFAIWRALPARWLPVDLIGSLLALAAVVAGVLAAKEHPAAKTVGLWVSGTWIIVGGVVCTALAWAAAGIVGLYGPVGSGGALVLFFVALLVLPYMVGVPILQLIHCLRR